MEKVLSERDLEQLRVKGLITAEETAYLVGEQVVVENLVNRERRLIEVAGLILESRKGLLKG